MYQEKRQVENMEKKENTEYIRKETSKFDYLRNDCSERHLQGISFLIKRIM